MNPHYLTIQIDQPSLIQIGDKVIELHCVRGKLTRVGITCDEPIRIDGRLVEPPE